MEIVFVNVVVITAFYVVTLMSHLSVFPIYYLEPARLFVIFTFFLTNRRNAILLGITLLLMSNIFTAHPYTIKALLIMTELVLNVYLMSYLNKQNTNAFFAVFLSVITSKIYYYIVKWILISTLLIKSELISTPLITQLILSIIVSCLIFFSISGSKSDYVQN